MEAVQCADMSRSPRNDRRASRRGGPGVSVALTEAVARANHVLTRELKREVIVLHLKPDVTIRTSAASRKCAQHLRARVDGRRLVARLRDKQCDDSE